MGARLKSSASPLVASTTSSLLGLMAPYGRNGVAQGVRLHRRVSPHAGIQLGNVGRAHQRLVTLQIDVNVEFTCAITSASRSEAEGWSGEVMTHWPPTAFTPSATRWLPLRHARGVPPAPAHTHVSPTLGLPMMSASGLPGTRVDA